ncbi:mitochondrial calcium uniporter regulator [Schizosaccharomyces osmophilus]|uniref:Mitochondrial calcium uniporter regulator n=1 Tax=Schizosaccharomyces osmophilus TaxID=2545709 RepID=A0AAF0AW43_9SCHI|nr:mitochondrial calcium uniporter regulator [Schizosaccharomyces osmophilus]WBW73098.1 mitochondrial calcium uniporter regulator [Schizosaccharomyces osmophilus]
MSRILRKEVFRGFGAVNPNAFRPSIPSFRRLVASYEPSQAVIRESTARLVQAGYTPDKARAFTNLMQGITAEALTELEKNIGFKAKQDSVSFQQKKTFIQIRNYLETIEEQEFDKIRQDSQSLVGEAEKIKSSVRDDVKSSLAEVRLTLNLEKGRMKDAGLQKNSSVHETEQKIIKEVDLLADEIKSMKIQTNQWFMGFLGILSSILLLILFYF